MPHTATVSARNRTDPLFAARFADISRKRKKRRIAEALAAKRGRTLRTKSTGKATTPVLSFDKHLSHDAIYRAAAAVVPTSLPPITRDDIICDMVLAVLEGHLDQSQLKTRSKEFIKEHWRMFGTLRDVSLDAQMFDDGGTTRKDRLGGHGADYW